MTSSAIQTESTGTDSSAGASGEPLTRHIPTGVFAVLLLGGAVMIFHTNRWHVTPPTVFLTIGWISVVLTARYMWQAAWSAADVKLDNEDYWLPVGKQDELRADKRSMLRAIKEIEFDRELGKLSDEDADALTRDYRRRAIDVIKAIELLDQGAELHAVKADDIPGQIAREVKARLAVAAAAAAGKGKGKKRNKQSDDEAESKDDTEPTDDTESKDDTEPTDETESKDEDEPRATEASDA